MRSNKGAIIITGASGSVGAAVSEELVRRGEAVIMACRNTEKAAAVRRDILTRVPEAKLEIEELKLDSFASIRAFAARMQERQIQALFNNAGTISRRFRLCEDGFEESLTVNYLGPYLLTRLLLPQMGPQGRVVNMVSLTCNLVKMDPKLFERSEKDFSQLGSYALSKLALMLFSLELSARESGVKVNMADPGIVDSNMISLGRWFDPLADLLFRPFCKSPKQAAIPAVNAILSDDNTKVFKGNGYGEVSRRSSSDTELSSWLWEKTEKILHFL